ncbi:MAG: ferric reductase-like transmembrane domain-containing protein [Gammaproteobacteria bacterium]|nr:ferric reductase-like transmembrane domain-containing protein [Gammaproteobacteria bacterium]
MGVQTPDEKEISLSDRDRSALRGVVWVGGIVIATTFAYAILRYVVFGPIAAENIPLYVFNKSLAWGSLILLAISMSMGALGRLWPGLFARHVWHRKYIGIMGFFIATLHICVSVFIMGFGYFRSFFTPTIKMTFIAELSMLFGLLSWFLLLFLAVTSFPSVQNNMSRNYWLRFHHWGVYAVVLGSLHVLYGYPSWFTPESWYGGMPPITLWSFAVMFVMLAVRFLGRPKN